MMYFCVIKTILEILSNLSIVVAAIIACTTFKFKLGVDERKLYLDNANKVSEVLSNVITYAKIENEYLAQINNAFEEASLYLNHDIVDFIDKIRKSLINLYNIQNNSTNLQSKEECNKHCKEELIKIWDYLYDSTIIYRKHIVSEPSAIFYSVKKKIEDFKAEQKQNLQKRRANQ